MFVVRKLQIAPLASDVAEKADRLLVVSCVYKLKRVAAFAVDQRGLGCRARS